VITEESPTDEPKKASRAGAKSPVESQWSRWTTHAGEEREDLALLWGPTRVGGTIAEENFSFSPVVASTRRSDPRIAPARATVGTNRSQACPFHVTRACPATSLFAPGLGELGLQLAARALPRIVRPRPADLVCDRPDVSLAVFLEDAPIGVSSPPATTVGPSALQPGGDAAPTGEWRIHEFRWYRRGLGWLPFPPDQLATSHRGRGNHARAVSSVGSEWRASLGAGGGKRYRASDRRDGGANRQSWY